MCDFAADAKAAEELMVGRTLTVARVRLRDLGVYVGTYCQPMIPSLYQPVADPMETIRTIKEIGPDRCIIGSDRSGAAHGRHQRHARFHPRPARLRHQTG